MPEGGTAATKQLAGIAKRRTMMGPGLNQLEYEAAMLRMQEMAVEFRKVQRAVNSTTGGPHRLRTALSGTGRQVSGTLKMITSLF
jgi:hypothetical protein